jgi:hypothetical protein
MRLSYRMKPGPVVSRDTASVVDAGFRTDCKGKVGEGFILFAIEDVKVLWRGTEGVQSFMGFIDFLKRDVIILQNLAIAFFLDK